MHGSEIFGIWVLSKRRENPNPGAPKKRKKNERENPSHDRTFPEQEPHRASGRTEAVHPRLGKLLQTGGHEKSGSQNRRMDEEKNPCDHLETVETSPDAKEGTGESRANERNSEKNRRIGKRSLENIKTKTDPSGPRK